MASVSPTSLLLLISVSLSISIALNSTVNEDLANLKPPLDFNTTIMNNCLNNPSLRYCKSSPMDLNEIFKSTIVASHLCNESKNPNCVESFSKIDLRNRSKIAPLYLSYTFFWKFCPLSIISIDLSNNFITGSFPIDILHCTQIQSLDLSFNDFKGDFPLESFSSLTNLTFLNLSYNHFSESKIKDSSFFNRFNASSFLHSGLIPNRKIYKFRAVLLLLGFPVSVILVIGVLWWVCLKRPDYLPRVLQRKHVVTLSMLKAATNNFSRRKLVVKSEGVDIYKGILRNGTVVRIEIYRDGFSGKNRQRFVQECKVLVELSHKNLIRILGWCNDRNLRAIVTDWIEGGSIEMWLSGSAPPWNQRLKILMGVVEGMRYLQEQWPEVGYDLKTQSILISDGHIEPLISRFKVGDRSNNTQIYKFGVFLLEMITNKRPWQEFDSNETGFVEHVRMNYPENLLQMIDSRMELSEEMLEQAKLGIGLGLLCTDLSATKYPSLNHIYHMIARAYNESCVAVGSRNRRRSS